MGFKVASKDAFFDERFEEEKEKEKKTRKKNDDDDDDDREPSSSFLSEDPFLSELSLSRPEPARALTIAPLPIRNGLNISWSAAANSTVPVSFYIVEYRSKDSIGWQAEKPLGWSTLTDRLV